MSVKPLYDMILINKLDVEPTASNGIITDSTGIHTQYSEGYILAVGDGYKKDDGLFPLTVKVGDTIIYRKNTEIALDNGINNEYFISEANVLAIKEKE